MISSLNAFWQWRFWVWKWILRDQILRFKSVERLVICPSKSFHSIGTEILTKCREIRVQRNFLSLQDFVVCRMMCDSGYIYGLNSGPWVLELRSSMVTIGRDCDTHWLQNLVRIFYWQIFHLYSFAFSWWVIQIQLILQTWSWFCYS